MGRVLGFPVRLTWSLPLFVALVTVVYAQYTSWLVGLGFAVCLELSVLLHELGHAVVARRFGIPVREITLELLGGHTFLGAAAPSPKAEFLVGMAGPAVTLGTGLAAAAAVATLPPGTTAAQVAFLVAFANLLLAVVNSLPGLPLDGGRALRALVWAVGRDRDRAILVAGRAGQLVAVALLAIVVAAYLEARLGPAFLVLNAVVAAYVWQGATAEVRHVRQQRLLPPVDVDQLVRPLVTVPAGTPLAEAQRRVVEGGLPAAVLGVVDGTGALVGLVDERAAGAVPPERRPWVTVDTVARSAATVVAVPAGLTVGQLLQVVRTVPASEYLVVGDDNQAVGVLRTGDLTAALRPPHQRDTGGASGVRDATAGEGDR